MSEAVSYSERIAKWVELLSGYVRPIRSMTMDLEICDNLYLVYIYDRDRDAVVANDITDKRNLPNQ